MIIRAIEIRDKATFIPALAILVRAENEAQHLPDAALWVPDYRTAIDYPDATV